MTKSFDVWRPIDGIPSHFLRADIHSLGISDVTVRLLRGFDEQNKSHGPTLVLHFQHVLGLMVHNEAHHPGLHEPTPEAEGWTFPCLIKRNSDWLSRLEQVIPENHSPTHYQLITGFEVIDVLCNGEVEAQWETQGDSSGP